MAAGPAVAAATTKTMTSHRLVVADFPVRAPVEPSLEDQQDYPAAPDHLRAPERPAEGHNHSAAGPAVAAAMTTKTMINRPLVAVACPVHALVERSLEDQQDCPVAPDHLRVPARPAEGINLPVDASAVGAMRMKRKTSRPLAVDYRAHDPEHLAADPAVALLDHLVGVRPVVRELLELQVAALVVLCQASRVAAPLKLVAVRVGLPVRSRKNRAAEDS